MGLLSSPVSRRRFFTRTGLVGGLGLIPGFTRFSDALAVRANQDSAEVYRRLGLKPIINAAGTYTHLGGSLMPTEVLDAMNRAAEHYVPIRELSRAVGERIATLAGAEGALVTTGAAGAIFVGTAACIAGDDADKMQRLPFTDGMKNEVVVQSLHKTNWTRLCEAAGARLIEVEYRDQMERAINGRTAQIHFLVADTHFGKYRDQPDAPRGKVSLQECIEIARAARVPLMVDAAAELPPAGNLSYYIEQGADLVCFSGGKGLRGPQNAGLLLGRKDLILKAEAFQSPYAGLGRDLKVAKETYIGMLAAVERYVKVDHDAEWKSWQAQIDHVKRVVDEVPGVTSGYVPKEIVNHVPRLWVNWDEQAFNFSREDCFTALRDGDPSIVPLRTPMGVTIVPWMMVPGQERVVARRLKEVLETARRTAGDRPVRDGGALTRLELDSPMDVWDPARAE
jgi:uncharacterized pyridoxal phosphate-dependent enzyme